MQTLLATVPGSVGLAHDSELGIHTGVCVHTYTDTYLSVGVGGSFKPGPYGGAQRV